MQSAIRTEIREFLRLTIPLASAQVAQAATGFVDTVMMGWLGKETLTGSYLLGFRLSFGGVGLWLGQLIGVSVAVGLFV